MSLISGGSMVWSKFYTKSALKKLLTLNLFGYNQSDSMLFRDRGNQSTGNCLNEAITTDPFPPIFLFTSHFFWSLGFPRW